MPDWLASHLPYVPLYLLEAVAVFAVAPAPPPVVLAPAQAESALSTSSSFGIHLRFAWSLMNASRSPAD